MMLVHVMFESIIDRIKDHKKNILVVIVPFILFAFSSIIFLKGAIFNPEANLFLHNYLDHRPFLEKIFDAERHRDGAFQAREFSYIFDFIDAHMIWMSIKYFHIPQFYSFTFYALVFAIIALTYLLYTTFFRQKNVKIFLLITALYLTTPALFLGGEYFRSSKILVSFFLILLIFLHYLYTQSKLQNKKLVTMIGVSLFLMSLSDLQGSYYVLVLVAVSVLLLIYFKSKKYLLLLAVNTTAVVLYILYLNSIGPLLIMHFSGKAPWLIKYGSLLKYYDALRINFVNATTFVGYQFSYFFGSGSFVVGLMLAIIFLSMFGITVRYARSHKTKLVFLPFSYYLPLLVVSTIGMVCLILAYSPGFTQIPLRLYYYNLSVVTLIYVFSLFIIAHTVRQYPKLQTLISILLLVSLLGNIRALPGYSDAIHNGEYLKTATDSTPSLRACIRETDRPYEQFFLPHHAYFTCELIRAKLRDPQVTLDKNGRPLNREK
jgi:hypothetical protein